MAIVYDDEPAAPAPAPAAPPATVQYDEPASSSADIWSRGTNAVPTLSSLITGQIKPDKYQQAAIDERDRLLKKGVPLPEGYTRRLMSGP